MDLRALSGHTVDLDRLPSHPVVLDVGCRGFDFTADILALRPGARIVAIDPDPIIERPDWLPVRCNFLKLALVHDKRDTSGYASYSTGEGNMLTDLDKYYDAKMLTVGCDNIVSVMDSVKVTHWDLVKLDCEGSEFDILANWPGPIADQISVEFHDGHPTKEYGPHREQRDRYFADLWLRSLKDYRIIQHEISKQGEWYGHWDTLLTL